jgi:hypothetical protein
MFNPRSSPFTEEVANVLFTTVDVPLRTDHKPIPTEGIFPLRVAEEAQSVWLIPAFAVVGRSSRVTETVDVEGGHTPLVMLHWKIFDPILNPLTGELFKLLFESVDVPVKTDHDPTPIEGIFPFKVAVETQSVWLLPAFEGVGRSSRVTETVDVEGGQTPFVMLHWKIFDPTLNPLTSELFKVLFESVEVPVNTDHKPTPIDGVFPLSVAVETQSVWLLPAFAGVGRSSRVIITVAVDAGQTPLVMLHWKILEPTLNPLTGELFKLLFESVEVPVRTDHDPTPIDGVFPFRVAVETQSVWLLPAFAVVGRSSRVTETVEVEGGHTPFVMFHWKIFEPTLNPLTDELFKVLFESDDVPVKTDHEPTPIDGVFPLSVAVETQSVWLLPALAGVGRSSRVIITVAVEAGQTPLVMLHWKILEPTLNPLTDELFKVLFESVEVPVKTDHDPTPIEGIFPFRVAVETQSVWLLPAFEVVGRSSRVTETVDAEGGQTPFVMLHWKIFDPTLNPLTDELFKLLFESVDVPVNTDQEPTPIDGVFPFNVAEEIQSV